MLARHFTFLATLFSVSVWGSTETSARVSAPLAQISACEQDFEAAPENYDSSRCFMLLASKVEPKRLTRSIEKLQALNPDSIYLELARRFVDPETRRNPDFYKALLRLRNQAKETSSEQDDVVILSHLVSQSTRLGRFKELQGWIDELVAASKVSRDPVAYAHATALVVQHRIEQVHDPSAGLDALEKLREDEEALPYFVRRVLLRTRADAHRRNLNFELAVRDFRSLKAEALKAKDPTACIADHGRAMVLMAKLSLVPSLPELEECIEAFETTVKLARSAGFRSIEAHALGSLSLLLYGKNAPATQVEESLEACFSAAKASGNVNLLGRCHIAKSQTLTLRAPQEALSHAKKAQSLLKSSPAVVDRIRALRQIVRSQWQSEGKEKGFANAMSILSEIEELRAKQSDRGSRMLALMSWAKDYYWLLSRLVNQEDPRADDLDLAFELSERVRARVLLETLSTPAESDARSDRPARNQTRSKFLGRSKFVMPSSVQKMLAEDQVMVLFQSASDRDFEGEQMGGTTAFILSAEHFEALALPADRKELGLLATFQRKAIKDGSSTLGVINRRLHSQLIEPILRRIALGKKRVILVLDGPLHRISFPELFPEHELSRSPSATYWARNHAQKRFRASAIPLALVDPSIAPQDAKSSVDSPRSGSGVARLPRLRHSRKEADFIRDKLNARSESLSDDSATLSAFMSRSKPSRGLLHIAAHSVVNEQEPRDSYISLAPEVNSKTPSRLTPKEISTLDFRDTLVVLGGCATGQGTSIAGEGVLSLAYAFLQSNASAVVATLWPVQDEASAIFFDYFYECLAQEKPVGHCLDKARGLSRASGMSKRTSEAFFILGNDQLSWSSEDSAKSRSISWTAWTAALAVLGLVGAVALVRRRARRE